MKKKKNVRVHRIYDNESDDVIRTEALSEKDIQEQVDKIVDVKSWTKSVDEEEDKA